MQRSVLITDGEQRAALAAVRSLGSAGYRCLIGAASKSIAGASRFAAREVHLPSPGADAQGYAAAVTEVVRAEGIDLVLGMTEPALLALLPRRDAVGALLPFPESGVFGRICDKAHVLRVAQTVGVRTPTQQVLASPSAAEGMDLPLPLVLKPARSIYTAADGTRWKVGVRWVNDAADLRRELMNLPEEAFPVLAQEVIEGPGVGVFVLIDRGRLIGQFAHRRLREKPPRGGVSVVRESYPMDEGLLARTMELLERLSWSGVAMVEYKRDDRTGEHVLMEINGRFWGSLQLAVDAGVDFPRLLVDSAFGEEVEPVTTYRNVTNRWFWGDVDHLLAVLRHGSSDGNRIGALGRWTADLLRPWRSEVFRWSDPAPFLRETRQWFASLGRP